MVSLHSNTQEQHWVTTRFFWDLCDFNRLSAPDESSREATAYVKGSGNSVALVQNDSRSAEMVISSNSSSDMAPERYDGPAEPFDHPAIFWIAMNKAQMPAYSLMVVLPNKIQSLSPLLGAPLRSLRSIQRAQVAGSCLAAWQVTALRPVERHVPMFEDVGAILGCASDTNP